MSQDVEIELLRDRLRAYTNLLEVSYLLLFKPHQDMEIRDINKEAFKRRLVEYGVVKDENPSR
jgi:hypothetical protein